MATAQTLQQWHDKIERWVPSWWFQNQFGNQIADAIFWGQAAVYQRIEQDMLDQQSSTFITQSPAPIIDLLGDERSLPRNSGESDSAYESRVQNCLFLAVNETEIQAVVNADLNNGSVFFIENFSYGFFDDADLTETPGFLYFDDYWSRVLDVTKFYNWWTLIVPLQTGGTDATIQAAVVSAIEANKALGTTYDILYESSSDTDSDD